MCIVFNMKKIITQECFFCFNSILLERFFPFLRIKKKRRRADSTQAPEKNKSKNEKQKEDVVSSIEKKLFFSGFGFGDT